MITHRDFIDAAISELINPTLDITRQHLEVLKLVYANNKPKVERINMNYSEDTAAVYFPILNERFFLEIHISKAPVKLSFVWLNSGHKAELVATSETLTFEQLKQTVNLKPLDGWSKGDLRKNQKSNDHFSRISFNPRNSLAYDFPEILMLLLDELENDADNVLALTHQAKTFISIIRYQYVSGNAGKYFDKALINRLARLNLSVDIDTWITGTPLKD